MSGNNREGDPEFSIAGDIHTDNEPRGKQLAFGIEKEKGSFLYS